MYREKKHTLLTLLLSITMACIMAGCSPKTESTTEAAAGNSDAASAVVYEKADEYLLSYYGIEPDQEITLKSVNEMIDALGGEPITGETLSDGAVLTVISAGEAEWLRLTWDKDDVHCALTNTDGAGRDALLAVYDGLEIAGKGRHYIGRITDDDLMEEMYMMLDSMSIFENWELEDVGTKLVLDGIVTGYGLKYSGFDAHFLDPYTIKYSHSDYQHAVQLAGLMRSEGMDGYIQLEPKVSVYEYLKEWGTPPAPSPTYAVQETENGRFLCYSIEYDLMIEFDSAEDKEKFHGLIEDYAKKYDDRVDEKGNVTAKLLAESWWQPLYSSATPVKNGEFQEMIDNVVYDRTGKYTIHTFTLPEGTSAVTDKVAEIAPERKMSPFKIYVNPAFIRYVTGTDHQ